MAKLTRRQRNELKGKPKKQSEKEAAKQTGQKVPKKQHVCVFHKYQEQPDGTYMCAICGHHFTRKMDEEELRKYLCYKKEFSLTELREMDACLMKVIYRKDTRGAITEFGTEELKGVNAITELFEYWHIFNCVSSNLKFENDVFEQKAYSVALQCFETEAFVINGFGALMKTPTMEKLNTLFDENERDQIRIDDYWRTAEMWSFKEEGHIYLYLVIPRFDGYFREFDYPDPRKVAARMYVFDLEGHLVKESIRLWSGQVFTVIT